MNQRKFWGNSDILPFLESFQLLWYFTWNFSFECKIWRNPNINLGLKKFKEFWSYFSTCAGSSVICAFDLGGYSLTGFHVGFFVTSFVLPVIFIILMWANLHLFHHQIDIMLSQVHHNADETLENGHLPCVKVSRWISTYYWTLLNIIEHYWILLNIHLSLGQSETKNIYMNCKTYFSL